jgi:hypothetical protein
VRWALRGSSRRLYAEGLYAEDGGTLGPKRIQEHNTLTAASRLAFVGSSWPTGVALAVLGV